MPLPAVNADAEDDPSDTPTKVGPMSLAVVATINKVEHTAAIRGTANMDIQVFLQPVNGSGFRAETSPPAR